MQKIFIQDQKTIGFVKNKQAISKTAAPKSFREFLNQRIRWTSKSARMIDPKVKAVLTFNYLFYLCCFMNLFVLPLVDISFLFIGILMLALKMVIDTLFFSNMLAFFDRKDLFNYMLPIQLMHITYVSLLGVLAIFGNYTWKGRRINR
jgi:cellulose synthase/poly-beta-1,6-N-acetylglucosamine synthase-like glycosyltransferase